MPTKRILKYVGLVMILGMLLAACGPAATQAPAPTQPAAPAGESPAAPTTPAEPTQPAAPAEKVEITYWHTLTGPAAEAQDEIAKRFNESQDGVTVQSELQGANYTELSAKLLADIAAGAGPCVSQLGTYEILQFAKSGVLVDLNPFMQGANGLDTSDWPGTMVQAGEVDGGTYWLPFNVSVPVLYYNKEAFEEAGLPGPPETWDQFFEYAEKLTTKDASGVVTRAGLGLWNISFPLVSAVWSNGGEFSTKDYSSITFDDPVIIDIMTKFQNLMKSGAAVIPTTASGGHRGAFINGKAAMILDSPAPFGDIYNNAVGFTPMVAQYPAGTAGKVYSPGGGGVVMIATCPAEKQEAAWEYIKYMLSPESLAYYGEQSGYAIFTPEAEALAADFLTDERYATMNDAAQYLRGDFSMNVSPAVRTAFDEALQKIFVDLADVGTTLTAQDAKAERDIQNETFTSN